MLLAACSSGPPTFELPEPIPNRYDHLDEDASARLFEVREMLEQGEEARARAELESLCQAFPEHVALGSWLQELELEAPSELPRSDRLDELRAVYRTRAEADPTPSRLVLAARLEPDLPAAELLLERALELDRGCAPAHYGLANVLLREGHYDLAEKAIDSALKADPTHLPTVRLLGWMRLRSGRRAEAAAVLGAWLEASEDDPLTSELERQETRLDLSIGLLADGQDAAAARALGEIEPALVDPVRYLSARVVLAHHLGLPYEARSLSVAAQEAEPSALLPAVQEALLLELDIGDPYEARRAWQRVLERSEEGEELGELVQRLRAEVHLQRLDRELTERSSPR